MAEIKTKLNDASVEIFLKRIEDENKKSDCFEILKMMRQITKEEPKMWGTSIVGFGSYHYKYESGREGDMFVIGFSPRKQNLTIYIVPGFKRFDELMTKLGKYKTGKSCLYIKKLVDIDVKVLRNLFTQSVKFMNNKYNS